MERVSIPDVDPATPDGGVERRGLAERLDATGVAINHYRVAPDAGLPGGLHAHADQEEAFVVLAGEATFETLDGDVRVEAGEAIRFAPGEFQTGRNDADEDLVVLAVGAPRDSTDVRVPQACPDCGHGDVRVDADADGVAFVCPDCGAERAAAPCPACGGDDLRFRLGSTTRTVVVCEACGAEYEDPPPRDRW